MATEEDWDFKDNLFKTKYRKAEDTMKGEVHRQNNELLKKKLNDTEMLIKDLMLKDNVYSSEQVKQEIVKAKNAGKQSLFTYIDLIVEEKNKIGSLGTAKCYFDLKSSLRIFILKEGRTDLTFKDITVSFLKKYEADFKTRGTTDNGISFYMRTLRAVLNRAIAEGACKKDIYPFNTYKISHLSTKTIKRAINKADIELIRNYACEPGSQLHRSKNIFLFSYYNRGINFSDIAMLKWDNIKANRLTYTRLKTDKYYNILLLDPALEILAFYRDSNYRDKDSYIFPILDEHRHNTPVSIQNRVHKVLGQTNKDLKSIGEQLGITTPLTTYVARHSYATVLKRSGVSTSVISEAMGHDSERTTQIYLDSFENDVLDEASKALL